MRSKIIVHQMEQKLIVVEKAKRIDGKYQSEG